MYQGDGRLVTSETRIKMTRKFKGNDNYLVFIGVIIIYFLTLKKSEISVGKKTQTIQISP